MAIRLSWNVSSDRLQDIYATTQAPVPAELPLSASMGVTVVGSELEVSKIMEESVAKRSIGGCQIKMVQ